MKLVNEIDRWTIFAAVAVLISALILWATTELTSTRPASVVSCGCRIHCDCKTCRCFDDAALPQNNVR